MNTRKTELCPLCGRTTRVIADDAPGYQEGTTFTIRECEGCFASFASPLVCDDALYGRIYTNARFVPGYNRYYRYALEIIDQAHPLEYLSRQEESYWAVAQRLKQKQREKDRLRILEVGCGMGYFTYAIAQDGFAIDGVDLSQEAVDWALQHYGPHYSCKSLQDVKAGNVRYDVIILNQIIEHLPDVHTFMAEALDLLTPEGEIIITTPNKTALPDAEWDSDLPPVHLWWFGEEAMNVLAQRHACSIVFTDFSLFYKSCVRLKPLPMTIRSWQPVFNAAGELIQHEILPPIGPARKILERTGVLPVLRRIRAGLDNKRRWQGARGPIIAAVLRRTGKIP